MAWRGAMGGYLETTRPGALAMHPQLFENGIPAIDGHDAPRQRQYIAPVTVGMKQRLEQRIVAYRYRPLKRTYYLCVPCGNSQFNPLCAEEIYSYALHHSKSTR
jgi:hypothetical protein